MLGFENRRHKNLYAQTLAPVGITPVEDAGAEIDCSYCHARGVVWPEHQGSSLAPDVLCNGE